MSYAAGVSGGDTIKIHQSNWITSSILNQGMWFSSDLVLEESCHPTESSRLLVDAATGSVPFQMWMW